MRCEICGEGSWSDGLPDWLCWDAVALPDEVDAWVQRVRENPYDGARRFLGAIGSPRAADALRAHLSTDDPLVLSLVVSSLGWSGDSSDGPALIGLIDHDDAEVRHAVAGALAELEVAAAVTPLAARLRGLDLERRERHRLLECLAWLRHPGVLPDLRAILREGGPTAPVTRRAVAELLVWIGDAEDRAQIARLAAARLARSAAEGYVEPRHTRIAAWETYVRLVGTSWPNEVAEAEAALSDAERLALTWHPIVMPSHAPDAEALTPTERPRRSIAGFTSEAPAPSPEPPAKFFGQPDWREDPTWPIGGDGRPLLFFGQLPVGAGRTGYLFTAGPNEFQTLGPGSALVVQPGGRCHLATEPRREGPRYFDWVSDRTRFFVRSRRLPAPERFVVWTDGSDPLEFPRGAVAGTDHWNKVGGAPVWLQGDETPGAEWRFAFQFEAGLAGSERGDGAVFYGWVTDSGEGALGWQCH